MARLIDADDFIKKLDLLGTHQYVLTKNQVKFLLMEQPTIEAEPVKHGKWIGLEYDGYADGYPVWEKWECSECGNEIDTEEPPAYCCDCGARMDGE